MIWIRDDSERFVNIDRWEFLDYQSLEDKENEEIAGYKIYLADKNGSEYILGYVKEADEDFLKQITLGFQPYFEDLATRIYYYLDREFDKDPVMCSENFETMFSARQKRINELIETRFVHSEVNT